MHLSWPGTQGLFHKYRGWEDERMNLPLLTSFLFPIHPSPHSPYTKYTSDASPSRGPLHMVLPLPAAHPCLHCILCLVTPVPLSDLSTSIPRPSLCALAFLCDWVFLHMIISIAPVSEATPLMWACVNDLSPYNPTRELEDLMRRPLPIPPAAASCPWNIRHHQGEWINDCVRYHDSNLFS